MKSFNNLRSARNSLLIEVGMVVYAIITISFRVTPSLLRVIWITIAVASTVNTVMLIEQYRQLRAEVREFATDVASTLTWVDTFTDNDGRIPEKLTISVPIAARRSECRVMNEPAVVTAWRSLTASLAQHQQTPALEIRKDHTEISVVFAPIA